MAEEMDQSEWKQSLCGCSENPRMCKKYSFYSTVVKMARTKNHLKVAAGAYVGLAWFIRPLKVWTRMDFVVVFCLALCPAFPQFP